MLEHRLLNRSIKQRSSAGYYVVSQELLSVFLLLRFSRPQTSQMVVGPKLAVVGLFQLQRM